MTADSKSLNDESVRTDGGNPMPDEKAAVIWWRLNQQRRWPQVQFGETEPNGEPLWCVSLVNPATRDFFAHELSDALTYAEQAGDR